MLTLINAEQADSFNSKRGTLSAKVGKDMAQHEGRVLQSSCSESDFAVNSSLYPAEVGCYVAADTHVDKGDVQIYMMSDTSSEGEPAIVYTGDVWLFVRMTSIEKTTTSYTYLYDTLCGGITSGTDHPSSTDWVCVGQGSGSASSTSFLNFGLVSKSEFTINCGCSTVSSGSDRLESPGTWAFVLGSGAATLLAVATLLKVY